MQCNCNNCYEYDEIMGGEMIMESYMAADFESGETMECEDKKILEKEVQKRNANGDNFVMTTRKEMLKRFHNIEVSN